MNPGEKEFTVTFDPVERSVVFAGSMRLRSAKEYDEVKALLRNALAQGYPELTLNFRGLEFLNSSGISTIGQFVVEARKLQQTRLILRGTAAYSWQARSLGTLQRIWDEVRLVIEP